MTDLSDLPARHEWERWLATCDPHDRVGDKLRRMLELEALGADMLLIRMGDTPEEHLRAAIAQAHAQFGRIDGVIYELENVEVGVIMPIAEVDHTAAERYLHTVARQLDVLAQEVQREPLKFCILTSSLSSILGGLGFIIHAAAHLFLDALAQYACGAGPVPWTSVNWDVWRFGESTRRTFGSALTDLAITPEDGEEAFRHLLQYTTIAQQLVSTSDLRVRLDEWMNPSVSQPDAASVPAHSRKARPSSGTLYVTPRTEPEQIIAGLWQEYLGIDQIGAHDSFFEIGGHSLIGTQIIARLCRIFQVNLPLRALFEAPTVAGLALAIEETIIDEITGVTTDEAGQ